MPIRLGTNGRMVFDKSVVQARNLAQGIHAERLRELSLGDACVGGTHARGFSWGLGRCTIQADRYTVRSVHTSTHGRGMGQA